VCAVFVVDFGSADEYNDSWTDYLVDQRYKQAIREDDERDCRVRAALCWMWVWTNSPEMANVPREIARMIGREKREVLIGVDGDIVLLTSLQGELVLESNASHWSRARKLRKAFSMVREAGFSINPI
jgi:hypothetical protein